MTSPPTVRTHLDSEWRAFAENTTLHGFREILRSDLIPTKILWSLIIITSTGALVYQSRGIVEPYLAESTVTQIVALNRSYPPPRVMIGIPTHLLIRSERQNGGDRSSTQQPPEMEPEAFLYARSIVEAETVLPNEIAGDFDPDRAKRKFDEYLRTNNLSWARAIEPHTFDLAPWLLSARIDQDILIPRRLIWYPFTYYIVEPKVELRTRPSEYSPITWDGRSEQSLVLHWSTNPTDRLTHVIVSSYSILDDIFPLRRGDKFKLQFDISANARLNLKRRQCKQYGDDDRFRYKKYDYFACREVCSLEAIHRRFPNACLIPPHTRYSLLDYYPRGIPCSNGMYVLMGKNGSRERVMNREKGEMLPMSQTIINDSQIKDAIIEDSKSCESSQCNPPPCNELTVSYQLNQGKLADDEPNDTSVVILNFPPPEDIIVFEEKYMYNTESLIGQWGGLAGLYLGASLMSFLEVICVWCSCCCGCVRRKKG